MLKSTEVLRTIGERTRRTMTRLTHSRRVKRVAGHTLITIIALIVSPYLLAAWRIALYGDQANQGALIIILILGLYGKDLCHEWLESRHETQKPAKPAGDANTRRRKRNKALRGRNH